MNDQNRNAAPAVGYKPVISSPSLHREFGKPSIIFNRNVDRFPPATGAGGQTFPFQIRDRSKKGEEPAAVVVVRSGKVNGLVPSGVSTGISLSDGTWTLFLDVEIDADGKVISATLSHADDGQPVDEDFHAFITLGQAVVAANQVSEIRQAAQHSLKFSACGRVVTDGELTTRGSYEFWGL